MLKVGLVVLIAISFVSTSVFAEPSIEVDVSSENIKSLDSVLVSGKITGVSEFKPVQLTIVDPDGVIVYSPLVEIEDGEFKKLLHPPLPSFKAGVYAVTASHEDTEITAQTQFVVTAQEIPRNPIEQRLVQEPVSDEPEVPIKSGITMTADAVIGSDTINVTGHTDMLGIDITLVVNSPTGNIISIAQVTPDLFGNFEVEIKTGGQMWKEDGMYTVTINQSGLLQYKESVQVEIKDGVVVPEFGVTVLLILTISIISIIIVSSKSKLGILPR